MADIKIYGTLHNVTGEPIAKAAQIKDDTLNETQAQINQSVNSQGEKLADIESGAQVNVVETIKVNGTALTPSNKEVNIVVPNWQEVDDEPIAGSNNLVKSGGVADEIALSGVYDVSAKNPTAGNNNDGKWESLSTLLSDANLNTLIPTTVRKGGMSIKFIQSSDNKYVQYRLMSDSFSTTESDWQGSTNEVKVDSKDLVSSKGVSLELVNDFGKQFNPSTWDLIGTCIIDSQGHWAVNVQFESKSFPAEDIRNKTLVVVANNIGAANIAFVKSFNYPGSITFASGETGRHIIAVNESDEFVVPNDANYVIVCTKNDNQDRTPALVSLKNGRIYDIEEELENKDVVPTKNSSKLVSSGGIEKYYTDNTGLQFDPSTWDLIGNCSINAQGTWAKGAPLESKSFPANMYRGKISVTANNIGISIISFLKAINFETGTGYPEFATGETGRHIIPTGTTEDFTIPSDTNYVVVCTKNDNENRTPADIRLVSLTPSLYQSLMNVQNDLNKTAFCNVANIRYYPQFVQGSVITEGANIGQTLTPISQVRIHSIIDTSLFKGSAFYVYAPNGYRVGYRFWDGVSASMSGTSGWLNGFVTIPVAERYVVVTLCKIPDTDNITPSDSVNVRFFVNTEISELFEFKANIEEKENYPYRYIGEKIQLDNKFNPTLYKTLPNWQNMQGGAVYGNYLVCLMATDELNNPTANGFIYDLATGTKLYDLLFGSTLGSKTYEMPHANQVSFGTKFYNSNSRFPLLYVSQVNGGSSTLWNNSERGVLVYDLQTEDDGETFTPVLVQAIIPDLTTIDSQTGKPVMENYIGKYTPNYIYDTDKDQLVVIGYPNDSWYNLSGEQPVAIFNVPLISDGDEIVLTESDVIDSYKLPVSNGLQQSFYRNGRIYISGGVANNGNIRVLDLSLKRVITYVDLTQWNNGEPQFLGYWNRKMLYYTAGTSGIIYDIVF